MKRKWKWGDKTKVAKKAGIAPSNLHDILNRKRQPRSPLIFKLKNAADEVLGTGAIQLEDFLRVADTKNRYFTNIPG
jgi:hypothetical protein